MRTTYKTADELNVGSLVLYTGALYYVGGQYLKEDTETVIALKLVPVLSDQPAITCDLSRNPGYMFKYITYPVFTVSPCGGEDDEIVAVSLYIFARRDTVASWTGGMLTPDGDLVLDSGDTAHYGDLIALIDTGDDFEYRVVDKTRVAKHYKLNYSED